MNSFKKFCITLAVALLILIPVQYVYAAPGADTLKSLFDKVDNYAKWRAGSTIADGYEISYNASYALRAYLLMYQTTGDKQYLDKYTAIADNVLAHRDSVVGKADFRGLKLPGWSSNHFDPNTTMHYAMATGMIATPLAQFATLVKSDSALANYTTKANTYLQAAKDAVAIHNKPANSQYIYRDNNWIEDSTTLQLKTPVNMNVAYGCALLAIYDATGDKSYLDKAVKIANYFKKHLTVNQSTNGYYWKYFPDHPSYSSVIEDLAHTPFATEFVYLGYHNGIFNATDMQRFANTATKTLAKSDGSIANRLNGSGTSTQPGKFLHWLWFEPWATSLLDTSYNIVKSRTSTYPMELAGIAMLNYFNSSGDTPTTPPPSDTQKPVVKVNSPAAGSQLKDTAVFEVSAGDNAGVDSLVLGFGTSTKGPWTEVAGAANLVGGTKENGNWQISWDVSGLEDGTYYVLARGTDAAGNMGFSSVTNYTVKNIVPDTERPVVKVNSPASGSQLKDTAVFEVSAGDNAGVDSLVLGFGTSTKGPWTEVAGAANLVGGTKENGNWQLSWDVSGLQDGNYYVKARAIDAAGNMGFSSATNYIVKNQAPLPAGNLIENGDFSSNLQGWSNKNNSAKISRDSSGNPALTNTANYDFFQEINLQPGNYKLNARTHAGTSQKAAMVVVVFYQADGSHKTASAFKHQHTGKTWEPMQEMKIQVPDTVVKARIFLTVEPGDSGYHHFDDVTLTAVR